MPVIRIAPASDSSITAKELLEDCLFGTLRRSTFSGSPFSKRTTTWRHAKHGRIRWQWLKNGQAVGTLLSDDEWQLLAAITGFVDRYLRDDIGYVAIQYEDGDWPPNSTPHTDARAKAVPRKGTSARAGGRGRV
jgi:hypothetical protein